MKSKKIIFIALALLLAQAGLAPLASAQTTRLNVGYSAVSADQFRPGLPRTAESSPRTAWKSS